MGTKTIVLATLILGAVLALVLAATGLATGAQTEPVSVSSSGEPGNNASSGPDISANGRFVAFNSGASNLVPRDTNDHPDVFVRDRVLGITERVSVSSTEKQGNKHSYEPAISANGRFVAFTSMASNLVPRDRNRVEDVFVRDRKLRTTRRVSVSSSGSQGNRSSFEPAISADGRYVAFASGSSNLVHRDTNGKTDVFVRDRKLHTTRRVSVTSTGGQAKGNDYVPRPAISGNGRYVAFQSDSTNLVPQETSRDGAVFVRDRKLHKTRLVSVSSTGHPANSMSVEPAISAGHFVAFWSLATNLVPGDRGYNGDPDVFVRNLRRHTTTMASVLANGKHDASETRPAISGDGRYVAFASRLPGGVYVRDRQLHTTETVDSGGGEPAISADGRYVAFTLYSRVAGHYTSDVFVRGPLH